MKKQILFTMMVLLGLFCFSAYADEPAAGAAPTPVGADNCNLDRSAGDGETPPPVVLDANGNPVIPE